MEKYNSKWNNKGYLIGRVVDGSIKNVNLFGGEFYQANFAYANKTNDKEFVIPIIFSEKNKKTIDSSIRRNKPVVIRGKLRSYNSDYHLFVLFQVDKAKFDTASIFNPNIISLKAATTKRKGKFINTKNGDGVMNWVCQVAEFNENGECVDMNFIPVVFFGSMAKKIGRLDEKSQYKINMQGIFVNRDYTVRKGEEKVKMTAFEYVVLQVEEITKKTLSQNNVEEEREI